MISYSRITKLYLYLNVLFSHHQMVIFCCFLSPCVISSHRKLFITRHEPPRLCCAHICFVLNGNDLRSFIKCYTRVCLIKQYSSSIIKVNMNKRRPHNSLLQSTQYWKLPKCLHHVVKYSYFLINLMLLEKKQHLDSYWYKIKHLTVCIFRKYMLFG